MVEEAREQESSIASNKDKYTLGTKENRKKQ